MDLKSYFSTLCRQLGVHLKAETPGIKSLISGKNGKNKNGIVARYNFGEFFMDLYYIESGKSSYAQQTIWLSFFFDREPSITFSVYDILSAAEPENFRCYTYSYVDSEELMKNCFREITELLERLIPKLSKIADTGIEKNKLILSQKQKINEYFGDNVIEASDLLKTSGEKILSMMFFNFFQYQIESAVLGAPAIFFKGNEEKALKILRKAKYRSLYEDNLLKYLENGGKAPEPSEAAKQASADKGAARHGADAKGALKLFLMTFIFAIPITAVLGIIFFLMVAITSRDALYIFGIKENLIFIPIFSIIPGVTAALNVISSRKGRTKKHSKNIQSPEIPSSVKNLLKYFTIVVETIVIILLWTSVNSITSFNEKGILYSTEDFPFSRSICLYSSVDYAAVIDGYTYDGKFQEDKHIVIVTKSGIEIDLYNSTFFSAEEFQEKTEDFLEEKGIPIRHFKTIENTK